MKKKIGGHSSFDPASCCHWWKDVKRVFSISRFSILKLWLLVHWRMQLQEKLALLKIRSAQCWTVDHPTQLITKDITSVAFLENEDKNWRTLILRSCFLLPLMKGCQKSVFNFSIFYSETVISRSLKTATPRKAGAFENTISAVLDCWSLADCPAMSFVLVCWQQIEIPI